MKSYLSTICQQVEQQLMTPGDLARISNGEVFSIRYAKGNFFDYFGTYLFVAKKGGIEDWAIYGLPSVTQEEWNENEYIYPKLSNWGVVPLSSKIEMILGMGMKLTTEENIRLIVPCTDELFQLYRY